MRLCGHNPPNTVIPNAARRSEATKRKSRDLVFAFNYHKPAVTPRTAEEARSRIANLRREYRFYVYILQSSSRRCLCIGMTNDLHKRVFQHKTHCFGGFSDQYNAVRLVYWESFDDVHKAIGREKQLKGWRREKKMRLIEQLNPGWKDLAADWYSPATGTQGPSARAG